MRRILVVLILVVNSSEASEVVSPYELCQNTLSLISNTPNESIKKLGEPVSVKENDIKSRHSEVENKQIKHEYAYGSVSFLFITQPDKYLIEGAELNSQGFNENTLSLIPLTATELIKRYGKPYKQDDMVLTYSCSVDGNDWLEIKIKGNDIKGFKYCGYID